MLDESTRRALGDIIGSTVTNTKSLCVTTNRQYELLVHIKWGIEEELDAILEQAQKDATPQFAKRIGYIQLL